MIYKVTSLLRSEAVINILMADQYYVESKDHILIEAYQNGREQGYTICPPNMNKAIYVAQERKSDSMVVYVGNYSMQSISDDAYRNPHYFDDELQAAKYIRKILKECM